MFMSWVSSAADDASEILGTRRSQTRGSGDPDLDAAMDELDDYLGQGRTETEAREREEARRRAAEESQRHQKAYSSSNGYSRSSPPEALLQAYKTLGLSYGIPFPEVKAAYKRLLMQNHPDRNSATPEQMKRSTEISARINAAYHCIETWNTKGKLDDS
jgi:DnaJ-domain-containing protein 1